MNAQATPAEVKAAETIEMGTGNVFADLGLPDADERHLRVQLATRLNDLLQAEGLTQAAAAKHLGLAQPHVSELKNYKLTRFSSERLLHYITLMHRDVEIFIRPGAASPVPGMTAGAVTDVAPERLQQYDPLPRQALSQRPLVPLLDTMSAVFAAPDETLALHGATGLGEGAPAGSSLTPLADHEVRAILAETGPIFRPSLAPAPRWPISRPRPSPCAASAGLKRVATRARRLGQI